MTHGTTPAHPARAKFEAIALQVADVFSAMEQDAGHAPDTFSADGGASSNPFLMPVQADFLSRAVLCSTVEEVGALGAAAMAFDSLGTRFSTTSPHRCTMSQDFPPKRVPRSIAAGRRPSPRRGTASPPLRSVVMPRQLRGEGVKAIG